MSLNSRFIFLETVASNFMIVYVQSLKNVHTNILKNCYLQNSTRVGEGQPNNSTFIPLYLFNIYIENNLLI